MVCAGISVAFIAAAFFASFTPTSETADLYAEATAGPDGTICWPCETPLAAVRGKQLLDAIARSWPSAVVAMPSLRNATGIRRQVKFALHEAAVANLFGQQCGKQRFKDALLAMSWGEWNPDLHATIKLSNISPVDAANLYAENTWVDNKDIVPVVSSQAYAIMQIAKARWEA